MKITALVLNYNDRKSTVDCCSSLLKVVLSQKLILQPVIIDNNSKKNNLGLIKEKFPQFEFIINKKNLGFAEGNNAGIRWALKKDSDYIMLLNNDTLVEKNLIKNLLKIVNSDPKIGIVSPKIYFAPGFEYHKDWYKKIEKGKVIWYAGGLLDWQNILPSHRGVDEIDHGQYEQETETDFATGCCMLIKRKVFERIGLFDPRYFLYWEDIDFCIRAKKAGFKIFYVPKAFLWHKNAGSSGGAGESISVYYQTRNRMLFTFKYASLKTKLAVLKEGIKKLVRGNSIEKKAIKDFLLVRFGKKND